MALTTEIKLLISAQNKASAELAKVSSDVNKLQTNQLKQKQSSDKLRSTLVGLAGAYFAVKGVVIDSVKAYMESEKVMAQTNAVIKSTGGSAGMTAKQVASLAKEMQYLTGFTDEEVQSAENMLLTFTNIKDNIFPEVTETVLNMSIALGQDTKNSAIQLGKALQDPILGITALKRVGVAFTNDTKETIKVLVNEGKVLEAQKIILKELQTEFGNSARAFGETFAGRLKIAQGAVDDLRESLGKSLLNSLSVAVSGADMDLKKLQGRVENASRFIEKWITAFVIGLKWFGKMVGNVGAILVQSLIGQLEMFVAYGKDFWNNLKSIGSNIERFIGAIKKALTGDFEGALNDFKSMVSDAFANTTAQAEYNTSVMNELMGQFSSGTTQSLDEMDKAWALNAQETTAATGDIAGAYSDVGDSAGDMAKKVEDAKKKISALKKEMKDAIKSAKNDIKDLEKSYKEGEIEKEQELSKSIAQIIVDKDNELADLKKEFNKVETAEEKAKLNEQIKAIQDFLSKHKSDQKKYSKEIKSIRDFMAMDEIEQLKYTYAEERKLRLKDYEEQMEDLEDHLDDVKKEYKKKMKELRKELEKEGLNLTGMVSSGDGEDGGIDYSKRKKGQSKREYWSQVTGKPKSQYPGSQFGGTVNMGDGYIVGEHRPEVFVPSQTGNIKQVGQTGGGTITVNFNNPVVRNENDLQAIIKEVKRTLGRDSMLNRYGIRSA